MLKGAYLFYVWTGTAPRPTQDVDFLGFGQIDNASIKAILQTVIADNARAEDGLLFRESSIVTQSIRDAESYGGLRVTLLASLGNIRIPLKIDISVGDAITPAKKEEVIPSLIGLPQPRVFTHSSETVVADKFEAMVKLGMANSQMKDFFDLWYLSRNMTFDAAVLKQAIINTFARRGTPLPAGLPLALTDEFAFDAAKAMQWKAFLNKSRLHGHAPELLSKVVASIRAFIMPLLAAQSNH